jgi:GNAT superfamily N-acetyltransferase
MIFGYDILFVKMIKKLTSVYAYTVFDIINKAAVAYKDNIPADCYHEPYMTKEELYHEMGSMTFFGWEEEGKLVGVMGIQRVNDVTLIRHAYVIPNYQRKGVGSKLLDHLNLMTKTKKLLVGTWAGATWAIIFYQKHGFRILPNKDELLKKYWSIPQRQIETSVVLGITM